MTAHPAPSAVSRMGIAPARTGKAALSTYGRLLGFARPYWFRLLLGCMFSVVFAGSFLTILVAAPKVLSYLTGSLPDAPAELAAPATPGGADGGSVPDTATERPEVLPDRDGASAEVVPAVADSAEHKSLMSRLFGKAKTKALSGEQAQAADKLFGYSKGGVGDVLRGGLVLIGLLAVYSFGSFLSTYFLQWTGMRVVMDLRVRLFAHLQDLSVSFYQGTKTGETMSRTVTDTAALQHSVASILTDLVRQPVTALAIIGFLLYTQWKMALCSFLLLPTCVVPIVLIGRRIRRISREGHQATADMTSVMQESLSGVWVVKAFGQEEREVRRFTQFCRRTFRRSVAAVKARAFNDPITHIGGGVGMVMVLVYAKAMDIPFMEIAVFAGATAALYDPIKKLGRIHMEIQNCSAAADRVFEILDTPATVADRPGAIALDEPLREISFNHVAFEYDGGGPEAHRVFTDLDLRLPAGESLALVGPSGCGKTTLVSLLLRYFDVTGGSIRFNDHDLRDVTMASLRSRIGLVMQDTFLFADTISANIAYGRPDATPEEVRDAARRANADEFISALPDGYDTFLGERGAGLSGGQRQRIAIARAILRKPPVLILDEATSALDSESERIVQSDIEALMAAGVYTVIVVAHRLSTIAKCDHIAVLGNGGVLEYGTQAELLERKGVFHHLYTLQLGSAKVS